MCKSQVLGGLFLLKTKSFRWGSFTIIWTGVKSLRMALRNVCLMDLGNVLFYYRTLHEEQLFFPTSANISNGIFQLEFSLFGYTVLRVALLACRNTLKRGLMLHADFACGKTSHDTPSFVSTTFFFSFLKLNICFCGTSGNISHSCRRVTSVISQLCQKHFPPFLIMKNKPHPVFFFSFLLITLQHLPFRSGCLLLAVSALLWKHLISRCQCSQSLSHSLR